MKLGKRNRYKPETSLNSIISKRKIGEGEGIKKYDWEAERLT